MSVAGLDLNRGYLDDAKWLKANADLGDLVDKIKTAPALSEADVSTNVGICSIEGQASGIETDVCRSAYVYARRGV